MKSYNGIISEIERYAVKDGPGIRTVVFLKGCPLKCKWCSNPETQQTAYQLMYWQTRCIGCRQCISACPQQALAWSGTGVTVSRTKCSSCCRCTDICNSQALTMAGRRQTVEDVMDIIRKDKPYYHASGGGITFSGGECTSQPEFLISLAEACRLQDINTCIETCGYADWEIYERLLPFIDYFYYDLKLIDEEDHKTWTGVSNRKIKDNFCKLIAAGANLTVRIPCIPGISTTDKNIRDTIGFLREHAPGCHVSLLPYHRLGASKYGKLDMEYNLKELVPPSEEELNRIKKQFETDNFYITIGE